MKNIQLPKKANLLNDQNLACLNIIKTNTADVVGSMDTQSGPFKKSAIKTSGIPEQMDLCGEWQLRQVGNNRILPAKVPGCVHLDLLNAGEIEDPFYRDNELEMKWISETAWCYSRAFNVTEQFLMHQRVILVFQGLDTLADIRLNGQIIGRTDNMFRTWEFDVKDYLHVGENMLEITFASAVKYVRGCQSQRSLFGWSPEREVKGRGWIRKEPCNFGWDWGPVLPTCGIWRPVYLEAFDSARIIDAVICQDHRSGEVTLNITACIKKARPGSYQVKLSIMKGNETIAETRTAFHGETVAISLVIPNPELWWPINLGDQSLYCVNIILYNSEDQIIDQTQRRIGLRTLVLERKPDSWGESFQFVVNGVPFFAKGANWIPGDAISNRFTPQDYRRLLSDAAAANMNMIRVWGGGYYEEDIFYDLCDELGICVWQDFMFACSGYPIFDDAFIQNVRVEIEQNVRHLHHHPCIALWCGNNELEQGCIGPEWNEHQMSWSDYSKLFDKILPEIVHNIDPLANYWPGSPHSPQGNREDFNNPSCGDAHLWEVWQGLKPFEWYRTCEHRFNSEFGFQSFPEPRTVHSYTIKTDRNISSYIMEFHQRSLIGNSAIAQYMVDWFRWPGTFDNFLWLSQILQGMAIKYAVEHWRRSMPRGMGTLYWQLNDCWPVASWSSIDYYGRWKALHYMARKFYAPQLISTVENMDTGEVDLHLTNDLREKLLARINWMLVNLDGQVLERDNFDVAMDAQKTGCVKKLEFARYISRLGPQNILLYVELVKDGKLLSENLSLFSRPKHMEFPHSPIITTLKMISNTKYALTLITEKPALWVWVESTGADFRFSDNFFHMMACKPATIEITSKEPVPMDVMKQVLRVRSLRDTY